MDISAKLTQEKLLEILLTSYNLGHEKGSMNVTDLLEEIKQQVLSVVNSN